MAYTRIPSSNTSRNENELRAMLDSLASARTLLFQISDKMGQMNLDGGSIRIGEEYNLSEGDADALFNVLTSAANEQRDSSPFTLQMLQNFG